MLPIRTNLITIKESDLKFEMKNSAGAGGQNVNRNLTCVRVIHEPTGHVAESQETRHQYINKEIALRKLEAQLNQLEYDRRERETRKQKQFQVGISARSDKIRTYNYQHNRITDHRIVGDNTIHNLAAYMNGDSLEQMNNFMLRLESDRRQELVKQLRVAYEQNFAKISGKT